MESHWQQKNHLNQIKRYEQYLEANSHRKDCTIIKDGLNLGQIKTESTHVYCNDKSSEPLLDLNEALSTFLDKKIEKLQINDEDDCILTETSLVERSSLGNLFNYPNL